LPPLRFGVAGLKFGAAVHLPALLSLPDVKVTAIAGRRVDEARIVADRFGVETVADSWQSLLENDLDAVTFALPPLENERACEVALGKGIAVLSEKPLAGSVEAARRLQSLAGDIPNAIDFQFAELDAFQKLSALLASKQLGEIRRVQITWLVESYSQRNKAWSWKTDRQRGGGVTAVLGSHLFYLLEWLLGEIQELRSRTSSAATALFAPEGGEPADDTVDLWATHASGVTSSATYGNAAPSGPGHRWECVCDSGTITLENKTADYMAGFELIVNTDTGKQIDRWDSGTPGEDGRLAPFRALALRFTEAVRTGGRMHPDFSAGARVQELMAQVTEIGPLRA
jgi:predicted dehydrogenase